MEWNMEYLTRVHWKIRVQERRKLGEENWTNFVIPTSKRSRGDDRRNKEEHQEEASATIPKRGTGKKVPFETPVVAMHLKGFTRWFCTGETKDEVPPLRLLQIPVNASDAITGHNLQGLTKDQLRVYNWNTSTEWIYVVLSRVCTLKGLYLVRSLKLSDVRPPSQDYLSFLSRLKDIQETELSRFRRISSTYVWSIIIWMRISAGLEMVMRK